MPAGAAARRGHTTPQSENAGDRPPAVAQLQRPPRILLEIRVGRAIGLHVGFGFLMYLWKKILLFYEGHSGMNLCFPLVFVDMYRRVARQKAPKMDNPKGYCTGTAIHRRSRGSQNRIIAAQRETTRCRVCRRHARSQTQTRPHPRAWRHLHVSRWVLSTPTSSLWLLQRPPQRPWQPRPQPRILRCQTSLCAAIPFGAAMPYR